MYELLFLLGAIGFSALTALSFVGSHHQGGHDTGSHAGHHHGPSHGPTGEPVGRIRVAAPKHIAKSTATKGLKGKFGKGTFSLSPLDIFAYSLGFGATGLLVHPLHLAFEFLVAVLGALVLNHGMIKPLMAFLLRFASEPSKGLEGLVAHEVEAATRFDANGQGLVKAILEGEMVQVLARLEPGENSIVIKGDRVVVTSVDVSKNRLTVTRELS